MNIFFLHWNPEICAQMHLDKHVIKMILETCQLLCSAVHISGAYTPCYKLTHKNHPCAIWTRESIDNYMWLCELGLELCKEYTFRYGKTHKCYPYIVELKSNPPPLPNIGFTTPATAMPDIYKKYDPITAYRYYYIFDKTDILSWKGKIAGRPVPDWVQELSKCK
jgi:hypothetical protein